MKWIRERDALIAQTLAFVQSVTGRKDEPLPQASPPPLPASILDVASPALSPPPLEPAPEVSEPPGPAMPPPLEAPFQVAPLKAAGDFRSEVQARVANFRKHQERFEREREEYCAATLAKAREAMRDAIPRPPAGK